MDGILAVIGRLTIGPGRKPCFELWALLFLGALLFFFLSFLPQLFFNVGVLFDGGSDAADAELLQMKFVFGYSSQPSDFVGTQVAVVGCSGWWWGGGGGGGRRRRGTFF